MASDGSPNLEVNDVHNPTEQADPAEPLSNGASNPNAIDVDDLPSDGPPDDELTVNNAAIAERPSVPSRTQGCTGIIPLHKRSMNELIDWFFKYAPAIGGKDPNMYEMKKVGELNQANLYSVECTVRGIPRNNRFHPGLRCVKCQLVLFKRGDKLKAVVKKRGAMFKAVVQCLLVPSLSQEDGEVMHRFVRTKRADVNQNGWLLKEKITSLLGFFRAARVCFLILICLTLSIYSHHRL